MNFKFKNLLMTAGALLAFTACSNDSTDSIMSTEKESDLTVSVTIPGMKSSTRAGIDAPVAGDEALTPKADKVMAYVMRNGEAFLSAEAVEKETKYEAAFGPVVLNGTETVRVVAYKDGAQESAPTEKLKDIKIIDIQHDTTEDSENAGIARAIYAGDASLTKGTETDGVTVYRINIDAESIVARTEVSGGIKYNEDLVQSVALEQVTPLEYKESYLGKTVADPNTGNLLYVLTGDDYADISKEEGKQVVAHHVFDKNAPKLSIKMNAKIKKVHHTTIDGKPTITKINTKLPSGTEIDSYAYELEDGTFVTKSGKKEDVERDYYEISFNKDGKYTIGKNLGSNPEPALVFAASEDLNNQHFTLVIDKFVGDGNFKNELEGGNIYAIDLEKEITWSGKFGNEYSPDENVGGEEHETNKESVIYVTATVKKWNRHNVHVSVN